jgi:tungstate transport system permease protein
MIIAQTILIIPIVAALAHQTIADIWVQYRDELAAMNVGTAGNIFTLL